MALAGLFGCGTLLTAFAESRANLNVDGREADGLVVPLQTEGDAVDIGASEDVLDGEAPLDIRLAGFVRSAVGRVLRLGAVAPRPHDSGAVVLLVVVRTTEQLRGQHD